MDIKKANVNLLLGKIRAYLDAQPGAKKKGKRFIEAENALARMQKLFVGKDGEIALKGCGKSRPVMPGNKGIALKGCGKSRPVMLGNKGIALKGCRKSRPVMPGNKGIALKGCGKSRPVMPGS